jgi:hypothetical protein
MTKAGSRAALSLAVLLAGCGGGVSLIQETERGGVVVYPFKGDQGAMLSPFRRDALELMKNKCGGRYHIVREGETKGRARVASHMEGAQEIVQERRWGIEFQCQ